jgi:hypothetical protein
MLQERKKWPRFWSNPSLDICIMRDGTLSDAVDGWLTLYSWCRGRNMGELEYPAEDAAAAEAEADTEDAAEGHAGKDEGAEDTVGVIPAAKSTHLAAIHAMVRQCNGKCMHSCLEKMP